MTHRIKRIGTDGDDSIMLTVPEGTEYSLHGLEGDDTLVSEGPSQFGTWCFGGPGNDYLQAGDIYGEWGGNILNGGPGVDTMVGGGGRDQFYVTHRREVVMDASTTDGDMVYSTAKYYVLPENVEHLQMWECRLGDAIARGNALGNAMFGRWDDANLLIGLRGDDTLAGGDNLNSASDTLVGGLGSDQMSGGVGSIYEYHRAIESHRGHGIDRIYMAARSRIDLSKVDADSATADTNESFVFVGNAAFGDDATGQVRFEVIDSARTTIYISTDSDAAAEMEIQIINSPPLTAGTFIL
jgi:Ca2+-binding RTX toxin-like protein